MNDNENAIVVIEETEFEGADFDLDNLETTLEADLERQLGDLQLLEEDRKKIGNPEGLAETVGNVIWEQFVNQVGAVAGEDFIKENKGLTLDLRDEAHIQTTENFAKGKIAGHNTEIDYQKRYDDWQSNFRKDENGNVITRIDNRSGKEKAVLNKSARAPFDQGRPTGNLDSNTAMDHTVSAAEIIRDPAANAHLSKEEQLDFANSDKNLNKMDSAANQSKGDSTMKEWLDSERDGKKPAERFDIDEKQLRKKDKEARKEYEKRKKEGEARSIAAGKKSQKEEAVREGKAALRSAIMGVLMQLLKNIIKKFISWLRSAEKTLGNLISKIKEAIIEFAHNIKQTIATVGDAVGTTIATSLLGPIVRTLKKAWMFLKQGVKSVIDAIKYLRDPQNANQPFSLKVLQVSKIIIAGATGLGAIALGEVIEKGLMTMPVFAFEIPLLGSLASIVGIFLGGVVAGLIGALALNLINRFVAKRLKSENVVQQIGKHNEILNTQAKLIVVAEAKVERDREAAFGNMTERHSQGAAIMRNSLQNIADNDDIIARNRRRYDDVIDVGVSENEAALDDIFKKLDSLN